MKNMTNKIKQIFKDKMKKQSEYNEECFYHSLAPKNNLENIGPYYNRFMTALNKGDKTIAFAGRYGVGKTSIINSIINKMGMNDRFIRISLGDYGDNEKKHSSNDLLSKEIEVKILQQIIYTVKGSKLPLSRFKRIKYVGFLGKSIYFLVTSFVFALLTVIFSEQFSNLFSPMFMFFTECTSEYISRIICFLIYFCFAIIICNFVMFTEKILSVSIFKYKNLEINLSRKDNCSIFNKYLDEIVYFFKQTKTKYLVIEDLDRYEQLSLDVFKQLKELNFLLNANDIVKNNGGVVFIYSIRDDLFTKSEDRVKFFDCIIPVVSQVSRKNMKQYMINLYNEFKKNYSNVKVDNNLFSALSLYVYDRRLVTNIFMEFKAYIDILTKNQEINYTQLFALISYKNIYPVDFDSRVKLKGDLFNIFALKSKFIDVLKLNVENKIDELNEQVHSIELLKYQDIKLIKKAFVVDLLHEFKNSNIGYYDNIFIDVGDIRYSLKTFFEENMDLTELFNYNGELHFNGSKRKIPTNFIDKFASDFKKLNYDVNSIVTKKEFYLNQVNLIKAYTLQEILTSIDEDDIMNSCLLVDKEIIFSIFKNKLLLSLVKGGFIKENFENDLSYFISSDDLNDSDYTFIVAVDTNERLAFNYKLQNVDAVVDKIEIADFKKEAVLNFNILNKVINLLSSQKYVNFHDQFQNMNEYKFQFLINLCAFDYKLFTSFIPLIFNDDVVSYLINCENIDLDYEKWIKVVLENVDLSNYKDSCKKLGFLLENNILLFNKLEFNTMCLDNLRRLQVKINDYGSIENNVIECFYNNNIFTPNFSFYNRLLSIYNFEKYYNDSRVVDVLANNDEFKKFTSKLIVSADFKQFYNYFKIYNSASHSIIKLLNNKELSLDNKLLVLEKEENKIEKISSIVDKEMWHTILEKRYCKISFENILDYYTYINCIDDLIIDLMGDSSFIYEALVNHPKYDLFEIDFIYSNESNLIDYENIAKKFVWIIDGFDEQRKINFKLLEYLIQYNKVELNVDTYNSLLSNTYILLSLIERNFEDFISIKEDVEYDISLLEAILKLKVNISNKVGLINEENVNLISKPILFELCDDIINDKVLLPDNLINNLFMCLDKYHALKLFIYLLDLNIYTFNYLALIDEKYAKIRDGVSTTLTLDNNTGNRAICNALLEKGIINKFDIIEEKIRISYSKNKITNEV